MINDIYLIFGIFLFSREKQGCKIWEKFWIGGRECWDAESTADLVKRKKNGHLNLPIIMNLFFTNNKLLMYHIISTY